MRGSLDAAPAALPAELDTAAAKLVYLGIATAGTATVEELRDRLDVGKLTLFPVLERLESAGLVERDGDRYRAAQ